MQGDRFKVLYLSDSLGTPIQPRGIFNYSISAVEILKDLGANITLVVEGAPGYGLRSKLVRAFRRRSKQAILSAQLAEVYRYFSESLFAFPWRYPRGPLRLITENIPVVARVSQMLHSMILRDRGTLLPNRADAIDFIPTRTRHLRLADNLLVISRVYSLALTRATHDIAPPVIDASGYALVVVDTPHYAKIEGIDPKRILTVVHDLIPLRDPTMGADWRKLFLKKLAATIDMQGNLIFVSEYTRDTFRFYFPDRLPDRTELIVYPAIRRELMTAAQDDQGSARAAMAIERGPSSSVTQTPVRRAIANRRDAWRSQQAAGSWNSALPYFVTAVSDEPRKNIQTLVNAFDKLRGIANMVIIGEVDAARYIQGDASRFDNIRFTGFVPESDKINIVRHSAGVVFASFSEGFGIPVVEGAILNVPVLCSDIPVFREVAGNMATYFDPYESDTLVASISSVLANLRRAQAMANALRESVSKRFSQEVMRERLSAALQNLGIATSSRPRAISEQTNQL